MREETEETEREVDRIIAEAKLDCIDRGEGKGRRHVFINHSDVCICGDIDLKRERMK